MLFTVLGDIKLQKHNFFEYVWVTFSFGVRGVQLFHENGQMFESPEASTNGSQPGVLTQGISAKRSQPRGSQVGDLSSSGP